MSGLDAVLLGAFGRVASGFWDVLLGGGFEFQCWSLFFPGGGRVRVPLFLVGMICGGPEV